MSNAQRAARRLLATGAAATVLVGGLAGTADAASYPLVTAAQAKAALPPSKSLPGGVKIVGSVRSAPRSVADLCATVTVKVPLAGGQISVADYASKAGLGSPAYLTYEVGVVNFGTPAEAVAGAAKMAKADKACVKTKTRTEDGVPEVITRTLIAKAASGAWTGYHSIDHLTATSGTASITLRAYETWLVRGNVIVLIDQIGAVTPTNGAQQEARRKAVIALVVKRLDAIK